MQPVKSTRRLLLVSVLDNLVDQAIFFRLDRRKDPVSLDVFFDLIERLAGMERQDPGCHLAHSQDLFGHDPNVGRLALGSA